MCSKLRDKDLSQHWDKAYDKSEVEKLGWYEEDPVPSLELISDLDLKKSARILNVGAGASTLIDSLLRLGYTGLIANDISASALQKLKDRLGDDKNLVEWIVEDLLAPKSLLEIDAIDLWHDRAVLHFFTKPEQRIAYFQTLRQMVKLNGQVIIAAFNLDGAEMCSGLPVYRYNLNMLENTLGDDFKVETSFNYTYIQPSGNSREYIYSSFIRQKVT